MMGPWAVSVGEPIIVYDISGNPLFRVANEQLARDAVRAVNSHDDLVAALKWYVENDDTHEQDGNEFWLAGKQRAIAVLAKAEGGK